MNDVAVFCIGSLVAVLSVINLSGCASTPLASTTHSYTQSLTPEKALSDPSSAFGTVIWGGVIVKTMQYNDRTQLEVKAYPLDKQQRPLSNKKALGTFLVQSPNNIGKMYFPEGRLVTVLGRLQGVAKFSTEEQSPVYPTVTLNDVHVWHSDASHNNGQLIFSIDANIVP